MDKLFVGAALAASIFTVSACETTSSRPYKASTENVMAAQSLLADSGTKVEVAEFSAAAEIDTSPTCRAMGALEVAPGQSPVDYIREAFQEELFSAGVIAAGGTQINGVVEQLEFNSFGTGAWKVTLRLSSDALPDGYTVAEDYSFKTSFSAISACQNVIDAFQPTVSSLLNKAINDPKFTQLASTQ